MEVDVDNEAEQLIFHCLRVARSSASLYPIAHTVPTAAKRCWKKATVQTSFVCIIQKIVTFNKFLSPEKIPNYRRTHEKALKESGIGKGDMVQVNLSNGQTIKVRWDDRTADDKTAHRLGLNPLRGRWDIYSKSGQHPLDGIEVRSFQPA